VLAIWFTRALVYFLIQGAGLLVAYWWIGFDTSPDVFPPGLRLDPIHAGVHAVWGAVATYVGFVRPGYATGFVLAFAIFYLGLAILGTFGDHHFGMRLGGGENVFHWIIGPTAMAVGLIAAFRDHPAQD
jgi:hypothetical protein